MKKYCLVLFLMLNVGYSFGHDLLSEKAASDFSVTSLVVKGLLNSCMVCAESLRVTACSLASAGFSFMCTYAIIRALHSGFPSVQDLLHTITSDTPLCYASSAGVLALLLYHIDALRANAHSLGQTDAELEAAIEKYAKSLAEKDATMHYEEAYQKAKTCVAQKVNAAPTRFLGAGCSLACIIGAAYVYCKKSFA